MSIVAVQKITLIGPSAEKEPLIRWLQELGCAHLIPLAGAGLDHERRPAARTMAKTSSNALKALQFLHQAPRRQRQVSKARAHLSRFDPAQVEKQALELSERLADLRTRREHLVQRLKTLEPWGQFAYPPLEEMAGQRLWFYVVPPRDLHRVAAAAGCWEVVHRTGRACHVVVVAPEEPLNMPAPRAHVGNKPVSVLEEELEEVELAIEDAEAERDRLSRWALLLSRNLDALHDLAMRQEAAAMTCDLEPLFALQAWVPKARVEEVAAGARERGFVCEDEAPSPEDEPPTLLSNPAALSAGEDLVTFYATPGYRSWDPSGVVFASFTLFFAMILADAGYASILGVLLIAFWPRLGRSASGLRHRRLGAALVLASLGYGVLVGSYFGKTPPPGSWLDQACLLDMTDSDLMMRLCVLIGGVHIILGSLMEARRHGWHALALPPLGWAVFVASGLVAACGSLLQWPSLVQGGMVAAACGLISVMIFSAAGARTWSGRLTRGLGSLMGITSAFGDVFSYLRLFALGLAGSSLASTFNDMAGQIRGAVPGVGLLLALLVLVPGHALNLLLGVTGGVIHGLRLNVIEFFNWSLKEEGHLFTPLHLRTQTWTRT